MSPYKSIAAHYNQTTTRGATPIGLIVIQFDQILRDLRRAAAALDAGDVETRTAQINHAILVIAQLQNVLDHKRGQQAANRFEQFYNLTRSMLVQAQSAASRQILQQCIEMYSTLRQAWHQAETSQNSSAGPTDTRTTPSLGRSLTPEEPPAPTSTGVNWRA
jgi:flagellar secretion chaperone FliS